MKLLGIILITIALSWAFFILILYSDSMMNDNHTMWYSFICLFMIGAGIFLIIKARR
jgi:hypothetical protein